MVVVVVVAVVVYLYDSYRKNNNKQPNVVQIKSLKKLNLHSKDDT